MTRRIRMFGSLFLTAMGIVFAAAPLDWIERRLELDLDGGSGSLEFLVALSAFFLAVPHRVLGDGSL